MKPIKFTTLITLLLMVTAPVGLAEDDGDEYEYSTRHYLNGRILIRFHNNEIVMKNMQYYIIGLAEAYSSTGHIGEGLNKADMFHVIKRYYEENPKLVDTPVYEVLLEKYGVDSEG